MTNNEQKLIAIDLVLAVKLFVKVCNLRFGMFLKPLIAQVRYCKSTMFPFFIVGKPFASKNFRLLATWIRIISYDLLLYNLKQVQYRR